jgi:coenzyme PQQ synthesis protein D (PqqD)
VSSPTAQRAITSNSVVVAAKDQVCSDLAGEAVILSLRTGMYYGLNPVGAKIWTLLATPTRVADIRDSIVQQYDIPVERCEGDVLSVLQHLAAHGLIEIDETDR